MILLNGIFKQNYEWTCISETTVICYNTTVKLVILTNYLTQVTKLLMLSI